MGLDLIVVGGVGTIVSIGAFGGAVREQIKLNLLRMYEVVVEEPVPERLVLFVESLGGDQNGGDLD